MAQLKPRFADKTPEASLALEACGCLTKGGNMIHLTRLNRHQLIINSDLIKAIESAPDTVLTLVTGEKIIVLESTEQVLEEIVEFRRRVLSGLPTDAPRLIRPSAVVPEVVREIDPPSVEV